MDLFMEKKVSSELVYKSNFIELYKDIVECDNGNLASREYVKKCSAAVVIAVLPNGNFLMEKQFRYPYHDYMIEFPAGKCDPNEDPLETAKRELEEETGYSAQNMEYLGKLYPSCAYVDEVIHCYLATNLIKGSQHLDENESLEVFEISKENLEIMIKEGKIPDAKTLVTFLYYKECKKDN